MTTPPWLRLRQNGRTLLERYRVLPSGQKNQPPHDGPTHKIISWNLLHSIGASSDEIVRLVEREQPDLLLMQEATAVIDDLPRRIGGHYARVPLPGRHHGLALWSPTALPGEPIVVPLPPGTHVLRVCQAVNLGPFTVVNVHLSHGQVLNRRQLRHIAQFLPGHAAVLGDYNLLGPAMLPGFRDVGPRRHTHVMGDIVPIRIDRCLVRGLHCVEHAVLPRESSDHHPILVRLGVSATAQKAA
jgi:endonuclease/exonuclease/phosphatase (EEP) superfamily protein YafD